MNSGGSSSFWFQVEDTPGWLTEIDVFEIGGKAKGFERKYNMNLHVFRTPTKKEHWSAGGVWEAPWRLADDYHVYGLEWNKDDIKFFVDGVLVRSVENTHWHQPLFLIFDSRDNARVVRDAGRQGLALDVQRRVRAGVETKVELPRYVNRRQFLHGAEVVFPGKQSGGEGMTQRHPVAVLAPITGPRTDP